MITIKEFAESLKAEIVAIRQIRNPHSLKLLILFHKTAVQVTQRQLQIVTGGGNPMGHAVLEFLTEKQNVQIHEYVPRGQLKAFYVDKHIFMDTDLTEQERSCILAEELGHHFTADRNCLDQTKVNNLFCEWKGRIWSYEVMLPLSQLKAVLHTGITEVKELANLFELTEEFVTEALRYYFYRGQITENAPAGAATPDKGQ